MSPVEALTQIRDLCDTEAERPDHWRGQDYMDGRTALAEAVLDILDAVSVDAIPAQGIDRDTLVRTLTEWLEEDYPYEEDTEVDATSVSEGADRILALVRPVEGVLLSREKARWVISDTLMRVYDNGTSPNAAREAQAVLDDLEAAEKP